MKQRLLFLIMAQIKKSHVVTTSDFQKTNYLKTNLLKQIKKISTLGSILFHVNFRCAKLESLSVIRKFLNIKKHILQAKIK